MMSHREREEQVDEIESKLNASIRNGKLTEDLLSEVKSIFGG